jgi:hypothetical protein
VGRRALLCNKKKSLGRGDDSPTHQSLSFGVIDKTPGLITPNNFVKETFVCISHHDSVLARWLDLPFVQVSRSVDKNMYTTFLSQILF